MKLGIVGIRDGGFRLVAKLAALSVLTVAMAPDAQAASVQQEPGGRFRVLVVPMESSALDKKFGEKVAKAISDRLEGFSTHVPVPDKEFKRALKQYEVKPEDLNAIRARQLANLMGAQVVYFGNLKAAGSQYSVDGVFISVKTGDEVTVPEVAISDKSDASVERVAQAAIGAFEKQVKFGRAVTFCADYVGSQQPENALRNCNEALEINATSIPALFNKGLAFRQLFEGQTGTDGWADSAVTYFDRVLDNQPGHREALQNKAYLLSQMGMGQQASGVYRQYLELDPGNVPVRLKVAYDLAQADLMREAIDIIQDGLNYVEEDVDLLQSLGDYSLRYSSEDSSYVSIALGAYEKVLELKGETTDQSIIENALAAYNRAGRTQEAVNFAEKALESFADSPRLWSLYADALGRAERNADASAAMDKVLALDSNYPNGYLKRGQFKLQAGDESGGLADFNRAIESGGSSREDVFKLFFSQAIQLRNSGNLGNSVSYFERALQFAPANQKAEVEFWWGYTYYQLGEGLATPDNAGVPQLQRAQANFQAAMQHFNRAGNVRKEVPQLKDASERWLLNVEARIKQLSRG